jgi:hypothetical protein
MRIHAAQTRLYRFSEGAATARRAHSCDDVLEIPKHSNQELCMTAAYIEHRPLASDPHAAIAHHAVVVGGKEILDFKTQREAAEWAKAQGYKPVHVARERHLQNKDVPDHWRHFS